MGMDETLQLMALAIKRPSEFIDRIRPRFERRMEKLRPRRYAYQPESVPEAIVALSQCLNADLQTFMTEPQLHQIEQTVSEGIQNIPDESPLAKVHNSDLLVGRIYYAICRAVKPQFIVETGVAYGVSSAYILQALAENGSGTLHSIDLPGSLAKNSVDYTGWLIPQALRDRWQLHLGASRRVLPTLLPSLKAIDIFIHDSTHNYANMSFEFQIASQYLAPLALVLSDDAHRNAAFHDWAEATKPVWWAVAQQEDKNALFGLSVVKKQSP